MKIKKSEIKNIIKEALNELDWKTYANASKKRFEQRRAEKDPQKSRDLWTKAYDLERYAGENFDDEYVGNNKYDTLGDKLRGKKSSTFSVNKNRLLSNNGYQALGGRNKSGDELYNMGDGKFHSSRSGYTTPSKFFRDTELGSAYERGAKEIDDYHNNNYSYDNEHGWHLNESDLKRIVRENIKKVLKESTNNPIMLGDESDGYLWYVEIGNGISSVIFNIYAQNPQEALDSAVDYCEQEGWDGLFYDDDEGVIEYENDFITAGNSGHYLRLDSFIVRRM